MNHLFYKNICLVVCCLLIPALAFGQDCQSGWKQVNHHFGIQTVGNCVDVLVTETGSVVDGGTCGHGPYFIGFNGPGNVRFDFGSPILKLKVECSALNNFPNPPPPQQPSYEELAFYIDDTFHPLTNAGDPATCNGMQNAQVAPNGTLIGPMGGWGESLNLVIDQSMSSAQLFVNWVVGSPVGVPVSVFVCCLACSTDAGEMAATSLHLCDLQNVDLPVSVGAELDPDDILQYILCTDPNNLPGSIVATSSAPFFTFDPATMSTGVTYHILAIAGNNLNGNVDFDDPCFDQSNSVEVTWHYDPAVAFSVTDPEFCAGACKTIQVNFTGTAPFSLTFQLPWGGTETLAFPSATGSFEVCPPDQFPPGDFTIMAVSVSDAFCVCD